MIDLKQVPSGPHLNEVLDLGLEELDVLQQLVLVALELVEVLSVRLVQRVAGVLHRLVYQRWPVAHGPEELAGLVGFGELARVQRRPLQRQQAFCLHQVIASQAQPSGLKSMSTFASTTYRRQMYASAESDKPLKWTQKTADMQTSRRKGTRRPQPK
eukprot:scaffold124274_cov24-Prasinocladus_malaysianus.AAC.1